MSCVRRLEVGLHGFGRGGLGRRGFEGLDREQRVDGRRLGLGFGEAVAGGQRRLLEHADAVDQAVEVLAQPRVGAGAVRRFEQRVERAVELRLGALEVAERELLAGRRRNAGRTSAIRIAIGSGAGAQEWRLAATTGAGALRRDR